jgi:PTH2 family peptidyl-tRNA hydrolase
MPQAVGIAVALAAAFGAGFAVNAWLRRGKPTASPDLVIDTLAKRLPSVPEGKEESEGESEDTDLTEEEEEEEKGDERFKLVLLVRTDLGMNKGKQMAQCAHASLMAYQKIIRSANKNPANPQTKVQRQWLRRWSNGHCAKIALKLNTEAEGRAVEKAAQEIGVPTVHVIDAGRTQIEAGSLTVIAVGPAPVHIIDSLTAKFKLM